MRAFLLPAVIFRSNADFGRDFGTNVVRLGNLIEWKAAGRLVHEQHPVHQKVRWTGRRCRR